MIKYKRSEVEYEVGYIGDKAGVKVYFDKQVITDGARHTSYYKCHSTIPFNVVTDHHTFSLETLEGKIKNLPPTDEKGLDNQHILNKAKLALISFIEKNGAINPNSAADWECVEVCVPPTQTPQPSN